MKTRILFMLLYIFIYNVVLSQELKINNILPEKNIYNDNQLFKFHCNDLMKISKDFNQEKNVNSKLLTWNWDTIITYGYYDNAIQRLTRTLDFNGYLTIYLIDNFQNNMWVNNLKYTYTSDTHGNVLTELGVLWQNNTWVNYSLQTCTYDINGNLLSLLYEHLSGSNSKYRNTCTYNINNKKVTELIEVFTNNAWVNHSKYSYTYNIDGKILTSKRENWSNNTWSIYYELNTYTYDINGLLVSVLSNEGKSVIYTNNSSGNILTETYLNFDVNENRNNFSYDTCGNILSVIRELWFNDSWNYQSRNTYTYDINGNSLTGKNEIWTSNNSWSLCKDSLVVFSQQKRIFLVYPDTSYHCYKASFSSFNSGVMDLQNQNEFIIYPNPFSNYIILEKTSFPNNGVISIYNILGQILIQQPILDAKTVIDLSGFTKGLYMLMLNINDNIKIKKIIKE